MNLRKVLSALAVADWLQEIIACADADASGPLSPDIRSVKAMIEAHPETNVPLSEMARHCGLCLSHFKAKFRRQVGVPPSEYRLRQRMEKAGRFLAETSKSVTDIAFELGFSSSQHFARTFRRKPRRPVATTKEDRPPVQVTSESEGEMFILYS